MLAAAYFILSTPLVLFHVFPHVVVVEWWRLCFAVVASAIVAIHGLRRRSLDISGALAGLWVGFWMSIANLGFFAALLAFFLICSKASRFGAAKKRLFESEFKDGGQRNWEQVLCNGGFPSQMAAIFLSKAGAKEMALDFTRADEEPGHWAILSVIASLSCCFADTLASELGSVLSSGEPRLITTGQVVPRGTNGGVSGAGLAASLIGGALTGLAYSLGVASNQFSLSSSFQTIMIASIAGVIGSIVDSFLGATLQFSGICQQTGKIVEVDGLNIKRISGKQLLSNHSVNLISVIFTGVCIPLLFHV